MNPRLLKGFGFKMRSKIDFFKVIGVEYNLDLYGFCSPRGFKINSVFKFLHTILLVMRFYKIFALQVYAVLKV